MKKTKTLTESRILQPPNSNTNRFFQRPRNSLNLGNKPKHPWVLARRKDKKKATNSQNKDMGSMDLQSNAGKFPEETRPTLSYQHVF